MKQVLVLCTGNSCRSIIAEALINFTYPNQIKAYSSGVQSLGNVNPNAIKALHEFGIDDNTLHSKTVESMENIDYDLVVTVCDNAKETCPIFPNNVKTLHKNFDDPSGKKFFEYLKTVNSIKEELLPLIEKELLS